MSNPMYVERTRFETLDERGRVISTTFGARVYDDFGCTYSNFVKTQDDLLALDANDLIGQICEFNESAAEMIFTAQSVGSPIYVDDVLFPGDTSDDDAARFQLFRLRI